MPSVCAAKNGSKVGKNVSFSNGGDNTEESAGSKRLQSNGQGKGDTNQSGVAAAYTYSSTVAVV